MFKYIVILTFSFIISLCALGDSSIEQLSIVLKKKELISIQMTEISRSLKDEKQISNSRANKKKLLSLQVEFEKLNNNFQFLALGRLLNKEDEKKKKDILEEIQTLITPLLDSIKRLSERPRKIEGLKDKIAQASEEMERFNQSLSKIKRLIPLSSFPLNKKLESLKSELSRKIESLDLDKKQFKTELDELIGPDKSFIKIWGNVILNFFKTKGKNLFWALIVFLISIPFFSQIKKMILSLKVIQKPELKWIQRPISIIFTTFSLIFSIVLSALTLYLLDDWFLVTLFAFVVLGIFWSVKHWIPSMFYKIKLLLNLGPIREGEYIRWQGIAWKIEKLSYHCTLTNQNLDERKISVPIEELATVQSRPIIDDEIWFPCQKGNWTLLSDNTYGEIISLTKDTVQLKTLEHVVKTFGTLDFLKMNPVNYSDGFILENSISLSHSNSKSINGFVVELKDGANKYFKEILIDCQSLDIYIEAITLDEIKLNIRTKLSGKNAEKKKYYFRLINKYLLQFVASSEVELAKHNLSITQ